MHTALQCRASSMTTKSYSHFESGVRDPQRRRRSLLSVNRLTITTRFVSYLVTDLIRQSWHRLPVDCPCGLPAWRRTRPHLPARPFASIKMHSSPAAFPTTLSFPFVPSLFHLPTPPHPVVPQAAAPPPPKSTDTTRPVGIMPQRDRLALIRSTPRQHYLDRLTRASTVAQ